METNMEPDPALSLAQDVHAINDILFQTLELPLRQAWWETPLPAFDGYTPTELVLALRSPELLSYVETVYRNNELRNG